MEALFHSPLLLHAFPSLHVRPSLHPALLHYPQGSQPRRVRAPTIAARARFSWTGLVQELQEADLPKHAAAFAPLAVAVSACHALKIEAAKDLRIASFRSSVQLLSVGFLLKFVFEAEGLLPQALAVSFMVLIAGYTAGERSKQLPYSHLVATLSICIGTVGTLALMLLLRSFPSSPRYIIPTTGYVVGGSMSMVGGTLNRLYHDIQLHQGQIEVALALGALPNQAVLHYVRQAVAQGMGPWIDSFKTAGLITLPGSMAGMLVVGSSPLEAVQRQIQVLYMLLGAATISTAVACFLGWQMLFTRFYQLQLK